ncbi:MAG: ABC transporter ATP-binding protein [Alphaproteobacteria bacterium]|nr:ABC transporter ATP-binding protein [Alphaproteobacteria bacterium]
MKIKKDKTPKIKMNNVYKHFGSKKVLNGVDFEVAKGESLVIIGGSGTGKSVTIKCILGLLQPDSGSVEIDGVNTKKMNSKTREKVNANFGMLFQGAALFDSLTIWENVSFALMQGKHKMNKKVARKLAVEKLSEVGLGKEVADLYPSELSGGMQKRVGLARAIASNPEVIFFDEPTTGLDPIMGDIINDLIVKCVKNLGATAISITHDMASAKKIADKIAMLHEGKIIWYGTVKQLERTKNPYIRQFVEGVAEGPIKMKVSNE